MANSFVTLPAREVARTFPDERIAKDAQHILEWIRVAINRQSYLGALPPIRAFTAEDGSLLIEWIFDDFRVGFSLEQNQEDSGWFLVSKPEKGGIAASGSLVKAKARNIISWLVNFVINNVS